MFVFNSCYVSCDSIVKPRRERKVYCYEVHWRADSLVAAVGEF